LPADTILIAQNFKINFWVFDMTFITPFPLFVMVVWENGAAEICVDVTGNV